MKLVIFTVTSADYTLIGIYFFYLFFLSFTYFFVFFLLPVVYIFCCLCSLFLYTYICSYNIEMTRIVNLIVSFPSCVAYAIFSGSWSYLLYEFLPIVDSSVENGMTLIHYLSYHQLLTLSNNLSNFYSVLL